MLKQFEDYLKSRGIKKATSSGKRRKRSAEPTVITNLLSNEEVYISMYTLII